MQGIAGIAGCLWVCMHYHHFLFSPEIGGAARTAFLLAEDLHQRGHKSSVWLPPDGPAAREVRRLGPEVCTYNRAAAFSSWKFTTVCENLKIARRLQAGRPGVAHVHHPQLYGALRFGLSRSRLKRVVHVQIEEEEAGLRWAFKQPPDLIITCARFLVEPIRRVLPQASQKSQWIECVPNVVDTQRFFPGDKTEAKRRVGAPPVPLILMLANLAPHKGQETAIRAVSFLKERGIFVCCWLAGSEREGMTQYTTRLESLIRGLALADRVRLLGQREDAPDLLRAADYFLLPSTKEALPLPILEAQACRVPVLAAPTAGIPEAVSDRETGFLIAAGNAAEYGKCLDNLLGNSDLRARVTEAAFVKTTREYNRQ